MTNAERQPLQKRLSGMMANIPFPPSVNRLHRAVNGRVIASKEYRAWKGEALRELRLQDALDADYDGPVSVHIELRRPDKRKRDLPNYEKAILDVLQQARVYRDDSQVEQLVMTWGNKNLVTVSPL